MKSINFFNEDIDFKLNNRAAIKTWIKMVIEQEKQQLQNLNFIFCSDQYLWQLNQEYLNHDSFTDIITFDSSDSHKIIEGEVFISIDRVRENAALNDTTFIQELYRVMIHGVLHLIGFNDKTKTQRQTMRAKEDASISLLKI